MKFDFPNRQGEILSGNLELPAEKPIAYALFAHCFTCSKDIIAPNIISKTLTKSGIAVLRFDFTGLGNSQGDFENTNFSSNVDDLLSACEHLGKEFEAPELLIGHSLGGAAVLKAASKLSSIKAVVTIGAPSSVDHVKHLFSDDIEEIKNKGQAVVDLAGREFTIKKQFIDDIMSTDVLDEVKDFKKALLVMHSPTDNTVSVEHAASIFSSAKHPKSYVSLDDADHLLMNRTDATYAGEVIGAWAQRYISKRGDEVRKLETGKVYVKTRKGAKYTNDVSTTEHESVADEPESVKGNNLGMTPYEYLLAGLGACTSMTIKMYAEHKGLTIDEVEVILSHQKIDAKDCEDCETESGKVDVISKNIRIEGDLTEEQENRIREIAERCPVNRTLQSEVKMISG